MMQLLGHKIARVVDLSFLNNTIANRIRCVSSTANEFSTEMLVNDMVNSGGLKLTCENISFSTICILKSN